MRSKGAWPNIRQLFVAVAIVIAFAPHAAALNEQVLYSFGGPNGQYSPGALIFDRAGNLYGTAGSQGSGVVFELSPSVFGWTETVLHSFSGSDGANPGGPLMFDAAGNLYGTTADGGSSGNCSFSGCGVIYQLSPGPNGWTETALYDFTGESDGKYPTAGLVADSRGNLYGTTSFGGGSCDCGTVYQLARTATGWKFSVLYSFKGGSDGALPQGQLAKGPYGSLYGVAQNGGQLYCTSYTLPGCGTVFRLTPSGGGFWSFDVVYSFGGGNDGSYPSAGLVFDAAGNAYGTTLDGGGAADNGTVFMLTPVSGGEWQEMILHSFAAINDGKFPAAPLIIDKAGNLYGTTQFGGIGPYYGIAFRLARRSNGTWYETILHTFKGVSEELIDGQNPNSGLIFGKGPGVYGSTSLGGEWNGGTVYEITR